MADQYMFVASDSACAICASLNGQISSGEMELPHDGCMCQVIKLGDDDCPTYEADGGGSTRYGPNGNSFRIGVELTVYCCDGSEISESVEFDMGEESAYGDVVEAIDARIDHEATALASQCPGPEHGPAVS